MVITNLEKVKKTIPEMPGAESIQKQIPLSRADGVPTFSFRVFTIEPGGHTPFHRHPFEHMQYVIEGSGVLVADKREHKIKNTSKTHNLLIICAVPREYE